MRRATSSALQRATRSSPAAFKRAHEGAVGIGLARPDMALVDMRVAIDEGRQHDAAAKLDGARRRRLFAARRDAGDLALGDRDVGEREAVCVERSGETWSQRAMQAGIGKHVPARIGNDDVRWHRHALLAAGKSKTATRPQRSCLSALSCQRRRIRCEISVSARKMRMPAMEIRISAANSRGAFSR